MRFYKKVWGITWEFNSIGEYACFLLGRLLGIIIFIGGMYLFIKYVGEDDTNETPTQYYEVIPASTYQY